MSTEPIKAEEVYPGQWIAYRGDYDLGIRQGSGHTEAEAIADLIELEEDAGA